MRPFQFSIAGLLLLTVVVALAAAFGRAAEGWLWLIVIKAVLGAPLFVVSLSYWFAPILIFSLVIARPRWLAKYAILVGVVYGLCLSYFTMQIVFEHGFAGLLLFLGVTICWWLPQIVLLWGVWIYWKLSRRDAAAELRRRVLPESWQETGGGADGGKPAEEVAGPHALGSDLANLRGDG